MGVLAYPPPTLPCHASENRDHLVRLRVLPSRVDSKSAAGLRCRDRCRRSDDDEILGDRQEVVEGLRGHQLVNALVMLFPAQSALGVRSAEQGGHLITVGIGGAEVATSNGADVVWFGDGLRHSPQASPGPTRGGASAAAFRAE